MKHQLPTGIEVRRRPDGRGSTLVTAPGADRRGAPRGARRPARGPRRRAWSPCSAPHRLMPSRRTWWSSPTRVCATGSPPGSPSTSAPPAPGRATACAPTCGSSSRGSSSAPRWVPSGPTTTRGTPTPWPGGSSGCSPRVVPTPPASTTTLSPHAYARRVADLFDRYAVQRPEMLRAWAGGHDLDGPPGGSAEPLADGQRWQSTLWRALRAELGPSPAERLVELRRALDDRSSVPDLPGRLAVFGSSADVRHPALGARQPRRGPGPGPVLVIHPSPRRAAASSPVSVLDPPLRRPRPADAHHPLLVRRGGARPWKPRTSSA